MTGPRLVARLLAGLVICLLAAGCATIPSSSRPQIISETPPPAAEPAAGGDIRYDGIVPRPGEQPEDIVRDFLRVAGSYEREHARARAYLTQRGSKNWKDNIRTVVLEDPPYLSVQQGGEIVQMNAQQRGRVEADGSYIAARAPYPYTFRLAKVDGEWRIENPPPGLLIEVNTFYAAFRPYNVYFLDSTRTKVVPDSRWFAAPRESLPSQLVTAIEKGPSQWLSGAVRSDLEDATLQSNVEQDGGRVKVYLSARGTGADRLSDGAFAQLVWTLNQLGVGGVEVYLDGREARPPAAPTRFQQRLSDWRGFDPEGLPASTPALLIRNGAVRTTGDAALPGPPGRDGYGAVSVAQSTSGKLAVVRRATQGGFTLFAGSSMSLRPTVSGKTLTPPTWASAADEVWTVRNGRDVVLVPAIGDYTGVSAALDRLGPVKSLRLSRDGSRVAVVAGEGGRERLHLGVVLRDNTGSVRIERLLPLDVGMEGVADVSWLDALTLVVLVRDRQQGNALYTVGVDRASTARQVSRSQLPGPPEAIAAASTLPLLTVAAGTLWRTLAIDDSWSAVSRPTGVVSAPVYPG